MTRDLSAIIHSVLVEIISEKIVERLTAFKRKALVLLDMSDYGLGDAVQELNKLQGDSWSLDVASSREVFEAIPSTFPGQTLAVPQTDWTVVDAASPTTLIDAMLAKSSLLIVPNMSLTLAAKVANGISDDVTSRIMSTALVSGKPIVAVKDGCCPACRAEDGRPFLVNEAYRSMMIAHLEALDRYGVSLCRAPKLSKVVCSTFDPLAIGKTKPKAVPQATLIPAQAPTSVTAEGKSVFGWRDAKMVCGTSLNIAKGTVVTPLALEELRARNIRVVRQ